MTDVPNSMRRRKSEQAYQRAKQEGTLKPLQEEKHLHRWADWILIENRFPYDLVFKTHHLLIPTRKFADRTEMKRGERIALDAILASIGTEYEIIFENTPKQRSVKNLYHIHLANWKTRSMVGR